MLKIIYDRRGRAISDWEIDEEVNWAISDYRNDGIMLQRISTYSFIKAIMVVALTTDRLDIEELIFEYAGEHYKLNEDGQCPLDYLNGSVSKQTFDADMKLVDVRIDLMYKRLLRDSNA